MNTATIKAMTSTGKDDWETPHGFLISSMLSFISLWTRAAPTKRQSVPSTTLQRKMASSKTGGGDCFLQSALLPQDKGQSRQVSWVEKCAVEGQKPGTVVVALLPARTDTELFHRYIYGKAEIRFLKGRVSFLDHGKEAGKPLFGSMICIWRTAT